MREPTALDKPESATPSNATPGSLPAPVRELLAAIREALNVPLADRPVDDAVRGELLTRRASDTRVIVELLLQHGNIGHHTARLREWTAEHPVTYPMWQARTEEAAAEEEVLLVEQASAHRCPAAHSDDPTPCGGPAVVTVLDATNAGADGCEHHAARLLASLERGRVYALPDAPDGAAIRVFKAADTTRPFVWFDGPRIDPSQLSRAENRRGSEAR